MAELPRLVFGVPEEPVLYPDAEDADLDQQLGLGALRWRVVDVSQRHVDAALAALDRLPAEPPAPKALAPEAS